MHNPPYEIYDGVRDSYAEKSSRINAILEILRKNKSFQIISPMIFPLKEIYSVHQKDYVLFIQKRSNLLKKNQVLYPSYFIMDTYTPIVKGTFEAARSSVDAALSGARLIIDGEKNVYALCRPPGHHAEYKSMGGYCYFNNAAISANYLSRYGRVAILDIDFHHGNGTQSIFYDRSDVLYVSIHADPRSKFPYSSGFFDEKGKNKGLGFNINYPLPLGTNDGQYRRILKKALRDIEFF